MILRKPRRHSKHCNTRHKSGPIGCPTHQPPRHPHPLAGLSNALLQQLHCQAQRARTLAQHAQRGLPLAQRSQRARPERVLGTVERGDRLALRRQAPLLQPQAIELFCQRPLSPVPSPSGCNIGSCTGAPSVARGGALDLAGEEGGGRGGCGRWFDAQRPQRTQLLGQPRPQLLFFM